MSLAEIQEAIEKLGSEEGAQLWTWFQEVQETDELVAAVDEGIQAAEEGRVIRNLGREELQRACGAGLHKERIRLTRGFLGSIFRGRSDLLRCLRTAAF